MLPFCFIVCSFTGFYSPPRFGTSHIFGYLVLRIPVICELFPRWWFWICESPLCRSFLSSLVFLRPLELRALEIGISPVLLQRQRWIWAVGGSSVSLNSAQNLAPGGVLGSHIHPWADGEAAVAHSRRSQWSGATYLKTEGKIDRYCYTQKTPKIKKVLPRGAFP